MTNFNNPAIAAASHILYLIEACGPQEIENLRGEVFDQTIGVGRSNVVEVTDSAIDILIETREIEKLDDTDADGIPWTYYDLLEGNDD